MKRYEHELKVGADAIDLIGHVNNIEYMRWIQDIAMRHSERVGLSWEVYQQLRAVFVIRRHEVDYLRAARLGETLHLATWVVEHTRITALRATEIRDANGALIVSARTTWVFVGLESGRPTRIPERIRVAFMEDEIESTEPASRAD